MPREQPSWIKVWKLKGNNLWRSPQPRVKYQVMANITSTFYTPPWRTKLSPYRTSKSPKINRLLGELWQQMLLCLDRYLSIWSPDIPLNMQIAQPPMLIGLWKIPWNLTGKSSTVPRMEFLSISLEVTSHSAYLLSQKPSGTATEGSTQASVVEKSSTWDECQGRN